MDKKSVPRGRLTRLGKVVGMTARVGRDALSTRVKQMLGGEDDPRVEAARRVLETLGEMKGAALKLGQTLSLGAGQLPPEVRELVTGLFSEAPPVAYEEIADQITEELGRTPETLFAEFETEPFAAASLGQVHRARLEDGTPVAVKVQYPGVEAALEDDLRNAGAVFKAMGIGTRFMGGHAYFEEMRSEVSAELDYRRELQLLEAFRGYLAPWPELVVPRVYPMMSTSRVLTLEYLPGPTLHAYCEADHATPAERFRVASQLMQAVYGPFLQHGVIHGDTHPGNFVVLADGRLGVLDFGSVKYLSEPFWRCYRDLFAARLQGQILDWVALLRSAGFIVTLPDDRADALLRRILAIAERPLLGPYSFADDRIVEDLRALAVSQAGELMRMRPPPEALLFFRAVAGVTYNARHLKAVGDFRPTFAQALGGAGSATVRVLTR